MWYSHFSGHRVGETWKVCWSHLHCQQYYSISQNTHPQTSLPIWQCLLFHFLSFHIPVIFCQYSSTGVVPFHPISLFELPYVTCFLFPLNQHYGKTAPFMVFSFLRNHWLFVFFKSNLKYSRRASLQMISSWFHVESCSYFRPNDLLKTLQGVILDVWSTADFFGVIEVETVYFAPLYCNPPKII